MKSLTPRLASAIAEVPYDVFSGELNNVPTDVAKQFEFDTKLKLFSNIQVNRLSKTNNKVCCNS
ncbi:hypothetical protein [Vibrio diabolicus]|uniref:hypothetical protein n=1 Tax=Vibrio diabolicus TaxID=50719 RepID=UPI0037523E0B